jgi:hypothetical protein
LRFKVVEIVLVVIQIGVLSALIVQAILMKIKDALRIPSVKFGVNVLGRLGCCSKLSYKLVH